MSSPIKGVSPSKFLLLQETASRVNSVASTAPGSTRLGQGVATPKKWMKLDAQGVVSYIKGDKHLMSKELAIPYRDLRLLDPEIPEAHPSAIFVREKALIINLESIRMVIAKDMVYILTVPSAVDRQVGVLPTPDAPLVKDLMLRLSNATEAVDKSPATWAERASHIDLALPYELRALEGALHVAVAALEADTLQLEHSIGASLDNLDRRISRRELENIQQGKSRITRLHAKLTRLTQVLEGILDDDADMADMYLARRAQLAANNTAGATQQSTEEVMAATDSTKAYKHDVVMQSEVQKQQEFSRPSFLDTRRFSQIRRRRSSTNGGFAKSFLQQSASIASEGGNAFWIEAPTLSWTKASNLGLVRSHHIAACESLLETYFMQADYALSRLVTLRDRTEATESLAKMHLAQRRNELVSFDLMLTVISTNVSFFGGVAAICGMNLWLAGSGAPKESFIICVILALVLSTGVMGAIFAYARHHQLLLIPSAP